MQRYQLLLDYWRREAPPLAHLAAAYVGWKPEAKAAEDVIEDPEDLYRFLGGMPGAVEVGV